MSDRYLILMRHAKSSWANESLADFDRPLNDRGRQAAPMMGRWLLENDLVPDRVLSSRAVRTQQTKELVLKQFAEPCTEIDLQELYLASPNKILESIATNATSDSKTLLVIGHNPGTEILASMLSGKAIVMPTAAIAVFRLRRASSWLIDLDDHQLRFENFVSPREIESSFGDS